MPQPADFLAKAGISFRQLDYWTSRGYLHADNASPGTGNHRYWSGDELRVAITMRRLVDAGLGPATAARVARGEAEIGPGIRVTVEEVA
jgi:DNA-binding transcriptional MerR regulator